jgi:glycosyltransferase involved in cell wall biosynthesis
MRILVNHLTAIRQKTGIGHHVTELVRCLRAQHPDDAFIAYPAPWTTAAILALEVIKNPLRGRSGAQRPGRAWLQNLARRGAAWHFRMACMGRSFDLYHEPNYIPLPCDRLTVATVHDLSVLRYPRWHPASRVAHFARHFEAGLRRCAHVLTGSEFTRCEIIATFSVPAERVTCTYHGIRPDFRPLDTAGIRPVLERLGLAGPYLLHVGTLEPRKNLLMLMQAYGDLPSGVRERCPLVLAGGWGWNATPLAEHYHDVARHRGVRLLGYVGDTDLPALYNGARALVFPSHYEGFGLPPLEMLACGGAVLASTAGSVVETAGPRAHLIEPTDLAGWRDAMQRVITNDDWHARLRRGGPELARPYTWERCARDTYRVYSAVLGRATPVARAA